MRVVVVVASALAACGTTDFPQTTASATALGTRILEHPHKDEQPFTRSLSGVLIPDGVTTVVVGTRDSVEGYCGATIELVTP
jgi:hypothetical protein